MATMDRDAILSAVRLQTLIEITNVSDADVVLIMNQGIDEISISHYWPFLEASTTQTLTSSTQTYSLPSDFEYMVAVVDDDFDNTIPYIDPETYFIRFGNDTGNSATVFNFYTIWEDKIYLTPTPSANDTDRLKLYYYKSGTQLSTGGTSPDWHEAFHPMLVEYCKWKLWEREEYYAQSERAFVVYQRYLASMVDWYVRRAKRMPAVAGDGIFRPRPQHHNIPLLNQ